MSVGFQDEQDKPRPLDRYVSTITIAAAIFVAIRLARLTDRELSASLVRTTVQQGVFLARTILDEALR